MERLWTTTFLSSKYHVTLWRIYRLCPQVRVYRVVPRRVALALRTRASAPGILECRFELANPLTWPTRVLTLPDKRPRTSAPHRITGMPSRTRRGSLPPSGLAKKVKNYATVGKNRNFYGNSWLSCTGDKLYVRGFKSNRLELATWSFKKRGTGHATALLAYLEEQLRDGLLPQTELYVESVLNPRFADFFRRREGWKEVPGPSFVYTV